MTDASKNDTQTPATEGTDEDAAVHEDSMNPHAEPKSMNPHSVPATGESEQATEE